MKLCSSDNYITILPYYNYITIPELKLKVIKIYGLYFEKWFVRQGQNKRKDNIDDLLKVSKKGNRAMWRQQNPRALYTYHE